jgi:hypothetical protein
MIEFNSELDIIDYLKCNDLLPNEFIYDDEMKLSVTSPTTLSYVSEDKDWVLVFEIDTRKIKYLTLI